MIKEFQMFLRIGFRDEWGMKRVLSDQGAMAAETLEEVERRMRRLGGDAGSAGRASAGR